MRIVFGVIFGLMIGGPAHAQVINGEGNFESNGGFDRSPEEVEAAKSTPKSRETERQRDDRLTR